MQGDDHVPPQLRPTMWKPGQSGNPKGNTKSLSEETRLHYGFTKADVRRRIQFLLLANKPELQKVLNSQESQWLDICIASIIVKCAKEGDPRRLEMLLDRVIGKVKEVIEIDGTIQHVASIDLSRVPMEKLVMIEEVLNAATMETSKRSDSSDSSGDRAPVPIEVLPSPKP